MRETLNRMFHDHSPQNRLGTWYGRVMTVIILLSLLPLCFKGTTPALTAIDLATTAVFIVDYALRWATSDLYLRRGARSFLIYPFTPMAIVDLVSILPAFSPLNQSWRLGRLFRLLRIVRAFKLVRYSRSMRIVERVLVEQRHPLGAVVIIAIAYVLVSALVVFNVEPETFDSLYDAVYWAADNGITQGVDDTHFVPNGTCTRGEAVTFLWRAKGEPEPTTTTNPFKDVKESDYFYKAVLWAVENGITVGVKADAFVPKQTCSTAHILTFLYRTLEIGADGWYEDAGAWAEKDGLLKDTGLTANPKVNCPRGAVVTFLYREQK